MTVEGSRWNVSQAHSDALGVPNHVLVKVQLFAGVDLPASPKKMLLASPKAKDQKPIAACAHEWHRQYRVRDDNLNSAVEAMDVGGPRRAKQEIAEQIGELLSLESVDDVVRYCAGRDGARPFLLATLLAATHREAEARELFRHPSCGDPALVAQHAARYGIDLTRS